MFDAIPTELKGKLITNGFINLDTLPNVRESGDWADVKTACSFTPAQLIQLKNYLFPSGKPPPSALFFLISPPL